MDIHFKHEAEHNLLTLPDAAKLKGVSAVTMWRWIEEKKIDFIPKGKMALVHRDDLKNLKRAYPKKRKTLKQLQTIIKI